MPKYIGRKINVWFWKESTRGTAVTATSWTPKTNMSFDDKFENVIDESSIGVIIDSAKAHQTKRWGEGDVEGNVWVNSIWLALLSLFGTVNTVTDSTGAYAHTFSVLNTNQHPSLTIRYSDDVDNLAFPLAMIESMTLSANVGEIATFSVTFKSKKGQTTTNTVTYTTDYTLLAKSGLFRIADNLAGLDGATDKCIQSFEITFTKNLEDIYCMGSLDPQDFVNKQFTIEGSFTAIYENASDYKTTALTNTDKAIRFSLTDTNTVIGASSSPELTINLAKANFTEWSRTMGNDEVVSQTVTFKGLYSIADSKAVDCVLVNTTASY